jgi:hypothetical protein
VNEKAGAPPAFLFDLMKTGPRISAKSASENFFPVSRNFCARSAIIVLPVFWTAPMRVFTLALAFCAIALPCLAQTVLKSEPLMLAPYEVAFVQNAVCPTGQVLKVTGAIRGLHRRKACVTLASEQASLAVATP